MFGSLSLSILGLFLVASSIFVSTETTTQCASEKLTSHYKPITSWESVYKGFNTTNETECEALCCLSLNCTMYIFSGNLTLYDNSNCVLLFCQNKSFCLDHLQDENGSGAVILMGIKGTGNVTATGLRKPSKYNQFTHSSLITSSYHSTANRSTNVLVHFNISQVKSSALTLQTLLNKTGITSTQTAKQTIKYDNTSTNHTHFLVPLNKNETNINHTHSSKQTSQSITGHLVIPNVTLNTTAYHTKPKLSSNTTVVPGKSNTSLSTTTHNIPSVSPTNIPLMDGKSNGSLIVTSTMVTTMNHTVSSLVKVSDTILPLGTTSSSGASVKTKVHTEIPTTSRVLENIHRSRYLNSSSIPVVHTPSSKNKFVERYSHTTPASLVISLIIGILFFGAVVFLIGRRWAETCLRRSYSRVDYLLNDYE